jgi:hypothetical protein
MRWGLILIISASVVSFIVFRKLQDTELSFDGWTSAQKLLSVSCLRHGACNEGLDVVRKVQA